MSDKGKPQPRQLQESQSLYVMVPAPCTQMMAVSERLFFQAGKLPNRCLMWSNSLRSLWYGTSALCTDEGRLSDILTVRQEVCQTDF